MFSEYSVNYPLKSGLETIDFSEDFGEYRRNGMSPTQVVAAKMFYRFFEHTFSLKTGKPQITLLEQQELSNYHCGY